MMTPESAGLCSEDRLAGLLARHQRLSVFCGQLVGCASDTSEGESEWDGDVISPKSRTKTSSCPFCPASAL